MANNMKLQSDANEEMVNKWDNDYLSYLKPFHIADDNSILYHYTGFEGLKGILLSRRLWFTDFRHLNDPSELKYSLSLVEQQIKKMSQDSQKLMNCFFWPKFNSIIETSYMVGTISFCREKDYLPSWRWYADNGGGFTIGIKSTIISQFDDANKKDGNNWLFGDYAINYENHSIFQEYINHTLNAAIKQYNDSQSLAVFPDLASEIFPLLPQCKHPGYKEEHEYRFVMLENNPKNMEGRKIHILRDNERGYDLRRNEKEDSEFVNPIPIVKSEVFDRGNIVEIGMGPRCHEEKTRRRIKELLNENGFDAEKIHIYHSEIPYGG